MQINLDLPPFLCRSLLSAMVAALVLSVSPGAPRAHGSEGQESDAAAVFSDDELFELVGPIALYPDELIAIVLPAATYPLDIVQAARYLEKYEKDNNLKPDEKWDSSVLGLLNYPEVINMMNEDLDWTWSLGEAVANQQEDVMVAVQTFRQKTDEAGNLESNEQVKIVHETETIVIQSTSTEVIYVPTYNYRTVVVYSAYPYPYVYSRPYPYYYRPAALFWTGLFVGRAIRYGVGWGRRGGGRNNITINNNNINIGGGNRGQVGRPGNRPSGGARSGTGKRSSASTRSSAGNRVANKTGGSTSRKTDRKSSGSTQRSKSGGTQKYRSGGSSGGSFSGVDRGQRSKVDSRRGHKSRSSRSTTRSSRSSGGGGRRSSGGRRG